MQRGGASGDTELNAGAVIALGAHAHAAAARERRVRFEHPVVVDEVARGENDAAACAERAALTEGLGDRADDPAAVVDHQRTYAVVRGDARRARLHGSDQHAHQQRPRLVGHLRHVTARRGHGDLAIRVALLGARPHEAIVGRRLAATALVEDRLERNPLGDEPRIMFDRPIAVEPDLRLVRRSADRRHQVLEHLVG